MKYTGRIPHASPARPSTAWVSPPALLVFIWAFVLGLRNLPFIRFEPLSMDVSVLMWSCGIAFTFIFAGFAIPLAGHTRTHAASMIQPVAFVRLATAFAIIGLVGALIRGFDIYFGRGLDFSDGIAIARLQNIELVEAGGAAQNPLSGIARIMKEFTTIAAMAVILHWENVPEKRRKLIFALFGIVLSQSILEGGRNTIAINLLFVASCAIVRLRLGKHAIPGSKYLRRAIGLIFIALPLFFIYVFIERFEALGYSPDRAIRGIEVLLNVEFSPTLTHLESDTAIVLVAAVAGIVLYFTNGLIELAWVLPWSAEHGPQFGSYNFSLLAVALDRLGVSQVSFDTTQLTRVGTYTTAIGELVIDFGVGGTVMLCAALGGLFGHWWYKAMHRPTLGTELGLALGIAGILASPLYSIVSGFLGTIVAALLFVLLLKYKIRWKRSPINKQIA